LPIKPLWEAAKNLGFAARPSLPRWAVCILRTIEINPVLIAGRHLFWGFATYWVYLAVPWLGFGDTAVYWLSIITMCVAVFFLWRVSRDTPTKWTLTLMGWALIVATILTIGFAILTITINPPSLYSLVVIGVFLLAGILWQLTKLTSKG
jgi:hypothetical protein